ncbi:hypothetical protein GV827_15870 [Sulfitobacter sp. JBTF-M27]|uniref:Transposase n=1 Tax=Sulfitobacter sediminilitoris TaxID=2698830 RepID=A0A6P0CHE0_9RHOB|nr:hypothetical protein [Sulfitobacter sediminilitoris]
MIAFIEEHRGVFGVGPICRVLGIAPSTFYAHKSVERDPDLASARAKRDLMDKPTSQKWRSFTPARSGKMVHYCSGDWCGLNPALTVRGASAIHRV